MIWCGRTGSRIDHESVNDLVAGNARVHVFTRRADRDPFTFAGVAKAVKVSDEVPVRVRWRFAWGQLARAAKNDR